MEPTGITLPIKTSPQGACQCVREEDRPWTANYRHLWSGGALFREERGFKYKLLSGGGTQSRSDQSIQLEKGASSRSNQLLGICCCERPCYSLSNSNITCSSSSSPLTCSITFTSNSACVLGQAGGEATGCEKCGALQWKTKQKQAWQLD